MSSTRPAEPGLTSQDIDEPPDEADVCALLGDERETQGPASFTVPRVERAVPTCRHLARAWLDAEQIHEEEARNAVLLVVSELTTNAVLHSASSYITSLLWRTADRIFVEVRDQGRSSSIPRLGRAKETDVHGRGLSLVTAVASKWGMRRSTGECAVWAAVAIGPEAAQASRVEPRSGPR
jgi:anti-sigma regulatory factor (Ser/Thr protein kinase)